VEVWWLRVEVPGGRWNGRYKEWPVAGRWPGVRREAYHAYREKMMAEQIRYDLNIYELFLPHCTYYTDVTKSTMHLPLQQKSWW
jgi:hypothetical protein